MKGLWLTPVGVCASGVGFAQSANSAHPLPAGQRTHPTRDTCLLGSECLGVSKTPVTACRVTGRGAKAKDACAVDGMKLIGKLTV